MTDNEHQDEQYELNEIREQIDRLITAVIKSNDSKWKWRIRNVLGVIAGTIAGTVVGQLCIQLYLHFYM